MRNAAEEIDVDAATLPELERELATVKREQKDVEADIERLEECDVAARCLRGYRRELEAQIESRKRDKEDNVDKQKPTVQLTGQNGNAFAVLGACKRAGRKAGMSKERLAEFQREATSGDYDHLLQTCHEYFDVR